MRRDEQADCGRFRPAAVLRREACRERPPFSEGFHDRLMRRLPTSPGPQPAPRQVAAEPGLRRRAVLPLTVSATVFAVACLMVTLSGFLSRADRRPGPMAGGGVERAASGRLAGGDPGESTIGREPEPVGIDRLPMFDEIEESLREGVTTLAVSLLEVPEWTTLADFDANGLVGDGGR